MQKITGASCFKRIALGHDANHYLQKGKKYLEDARKKQINNFPEAERLFTEAQKTLKKILPSERTPEIQQCLAQAYLEHGDLRRRIGLTEPAKLCYEAAREFNAPVADQRLAALHQSQVRHPSPTIFPNTASFSSHPHTENNFPSIEDAVRYFKHNASLASTHEDTVEHVREVQNTLQLATALQSSSKPEFSKLAEEIIQIFGRKDFKTLALWKEVIPLAASADAGRCLFLIGTAHTVIARPERLLDPSALQSLAVMIHYLPEMELARSRGALVDILKALTTRLHNAQQEGNIEELQCLLQTTSQVLDATVKAGVTGINREAVQEPLDQELERQGRMPELHFQAYYARQALRHIPNDESRTQEIWRRSKSLLVGAINLASAARTLDPKGFMEMFDAFNDAFSGIASITEAARGMMELANAAEEWGTTVQETSTAAFQGLRQLAKRWYAALQFLDTCLKEGLWSEFEYIVRQSPYKRNIAFLLGVCQRLEDIAYTQKEEAVQRAAIQFLGELGLNQEQQWGQHKQVQQAVYATLGRLEKRVSEPLRSHIQALRASFPMQSTHTVEVYIPPVWDPAWQQVGTQLLDEARTSLAIQLANQAVLDRLHSNSVRHALHKYYERLSDLSIQRVSGEKVSLDVCYINLAIVESQAQRQKDQEALKKQATTFARLPSAEQLEATNFNQLIPLEQLFEKQKLRNDSENIPKRILIQGRAGIGKTTLCKKLVHEYYHNGLWRDLFDNIVWIPLRQLKTAAYQRLENLLSECYFVAYDRVQAQSLAEAFEAHREKTLFILDGLDEVPEMLGEHHPSHLFLENLINQTHVLITSRPAGVSVAQCKELDLELETIGFSAENIQTYIEKFAPEADRAAIQQFIHRTPLIQGLVNIPIQLDALCYSWDSLPKKQTVTMANLYEAMVSKLWSKDSTRLERRRSEEKLIAYKLKERIAPEENYLSYLAFKGLEAGKIEFSWEDLSIYEEELYKTVGIDADTYKVKVTSFLHTADAKEPDEEKRSYHFLHLTFQEFFAAQFLAKHFQASTTPHQTSALTRATLHPLGPVPSQQELEAFIALHKYNPRYEIVWWMVAGLLKGAVLEYFFELLQGSPRDLIGGYHQQELMGCLNEARNALNVETVRKLEKELMKWFDFEMKSDSYGYSQLGCQSAFPEHLLLRLFDQSDERKRRIINTLGARPALSEAAVQALISVCQHENKDVRDAAARALESQRTLSEAVVQALIGACQHENEGVRWAAAGALGSQRTLSEAAVQALIGACQHENEGIRSAAARALGGQRTLSEAVVQALIGACQDENGFVRSVARRALRRGQRTLSEAAVQALIDVCHHENEDLRSVAARALGGQRTLSGAAVQALTDACQDKNEDVRWAAAGALGSQRTLSEAAVQALVGACQDENKWVRSAAARALGHQRTLSEAAAQALIGVCQDKNENVRYAAAGALGSQRTLSEAAVQALIGVCQHKNEGVRYTAAGALGGQRTLSEAAVQALIGVCQDENENVRWAAAGVLGSQRTLSEAAVQALVGACLDENEWVRSAAAMALGGQNMLSEAAVQALIGACLDENEDVRYAAAGTLGSQRTLSEAAVQALIGACLDENEDVRSVAARALGSQRTLSEAAVQALIGACQDENKDVKSAAVRALGAQNMLSEAAVQALIGACQDRNEDVRSAAAIVLGSQRTLSEAVVQALIGACQGGNKDIRSAAVRALGGQNMLSEAAVQALIGACQDENEGVRYAAAAALVPHLDVIYALLPNLSRSEIEKLCTGFLFHYSCGHIAPLYIQDHQLHFYSARGPGQIQLNAEQGRVIQDAFRAIQEKVGLFIGSEQHT